MVPRLLLCLLGGCLLTAVHPEPPAVCKGNQYQANSWCCDLCPPGNKLVNDCTEFSNTSCFPCTKGEFLDTWNRERHCHQHKYCDPNLGLRVQREGTLESDTTCTCNEGQHCTSNTCESCTPHSPCPPGFGVKQTATGVADTVCEPCPVGFFSNVSSVFDKCHPWTSCETKGLVELRAGTNQTDASCGFRYRMRALVVIPIIMGILFTVLLVSACTRKVANGPDDKAVYPKGKGQDPEEVEYFPATQSTAPVQETLHGGQPVSQEDGKESRISVQERQ